MWINILQGSYHVLDIVLSGLLHNFIMYLIDKLVNFLHITLLLYPTNTFINELRMLYLFIHILYFFSTSLKTT